MSRVSLIKSPRIDKKYRIYFDDGRKVEFGARGYEDYTIHKAPFRMRNYIVRPGGFVHHTTLKEKNADEVHKRMRDVTMSDSEEWKRKGMYTAGFWSRWLLWSHPTMKKSKDFITKKFNITFK